MSCSALPNRLPRSLAESAAYDPAWRHLQVEEFLRCRRRADQEGSAFCIPQWERDSWVRSHFKFRTGSIHLAVGCLPPVDSAETAVKVAIAAQAT